MRKHCTQTPGHRPVRHTPTPDGSRNDTGQGGFGRKEAPTGQGCMKGCMKAA